MKMTTNSQSDENQEEIVNNIAELYESEKNYVRYLRIVIDEVIFKLAPSELHAQSIMQTMTECDEKTRWLLPEYDYSYDLENIEVNNPRNRNMTPSRIERLATYFIESDWISLFSGLPNIYIFSIKLLQFLWDFESEGPEEIISNLGNFCSNFNAYVSEFDIYTEYVNAYDFNINLLSEVMERNEALASKLERITDQQSIESLLIMPIERVPRYELFLRNIRKAGAKLDCIPDIENTLENIQQAACSINDALADHENREILRQIRNILLRPPPGLVQPHRTLVKQGTAIKECRKADKPRQLWLFTDSIMYASTGAGLLHSAKLYTLGGASCVEEGQSLIILADRKSFILKFQSNVDAYAWQVNIKRQISHFEENEIIRKNVERTAPIWEKDEEETNCSICGQHFSLVKRRHHCRKCGRLTCAECSRGKQLIEFVDISKPVRVCDMCFWEQGSSHSDSD